MIVQHPVQGEVEVLLVTSWYRNQDKLRPDGSLDLHADVSFPTPYSLIIIYIQKNVLRV